MSTTPAFSPGPWITHGALVGSVRKWIFEDLYEQCSFHIAEKMPSSVKVGVRPISATSRAYSSGLSPCSAMSSGVMAGSFEVTCAVRLAPSRREGVGQDEEVASAASAGPLTQLAMCRSPPSPTRG